MIKFINMRIKGRGVGAAGCWSDRVNESGSRRGGGWPGMAGAAGNGAAGGGAAGGGSSREWQQQGMAAAGGGSSRGW